MWQSLVTSLGVTLINIHLVHTLIWLSSTFTSQFFEVQEVTNYSHLHRKLPILLQCFNNTVEHGSYDHGSYDNTDGTTFFLRSRQNPIFLMHFTTVIMTFLPRFLRQHGWYDMFWQSQMHFYHGSYDIFSPHNRVIQKSLHYEQKWQFFSRFLNYKISWIPRNLKTHENPNIFEFYFNSLLNVGLTVVNF